jgi:NADH/F420H2 dehydrogenase subunit C
MNNNELQNIINSWFPDSISNTVITETSDETESVQPISSNGLEFTEEESQFLNVTVQPEHFHKLMSQLKSNNETNFDYLFCLSGVDWGVELGVVYHLESTTHRHIIVVKIKTDDRENPAFESVYNIWATAEFHEREVYDFFGIIFNNHPNLKRLFLTDEWVGFPLRKDYVDEINMVIK